MMILTYLKFEHGKRIVRNKIMLTYMKFIEGKMIIRNKLYVSERN